MSRSGARNEVDPLRAFLWGKRASCRHALAVAVTVRGSLKPVTAVSMDLSAMGVLLRVSVASLAPRAGDDGIDPFTLAETHFRGHCPAQFKKQRVKVHMELVRLDYRPDEPEHLFLGFRFMHPLDARQLKRFGLAPSSVGPESHGRPSEMLALREADDPISCRIFNNGDRSRPMFEGLLLGVGERSLCIELPDADVGVLAKRLRGVKACVEVLEGDQVAWESAAWMQAIGFAEDPARGLELGMILETAPSRGLQKRFRRIAA
jgi:hypothetical protein